MTVVTEGDRRVSIAVSAGERGARRAATPSRVFEDDRRARSATQLHVVREPRVREVGRPGAVRVVRRSGLRPVGAVPGEVATCTVRPARRPLRALLWIGALTAAVVVGLAVLSAVGSAGSVPTATKVVQVRAGQTLSEIAADSAPGSDRAAVIARIEDLNGLSSTSVDAGQPLVVPVSGPSGR